MDETHRRRGFQGDVASVLSQQLRRADVPTRDLLHFYTTVVRPVLEYACPVWHPGLTAAHSELLESVQKRAIRIIYPDADYRGPP